MGMPCTVCAHPNRSEIDQRLAVQVVNVKQLARSYGLGRDAVARHRAKHLPAFLPALASRAGALTLDQLNAEAQRLYLVALDALAKAEAGTLAHVGEDGTATYAVSSTAVARLLREARASLDLLAKLAVAAPSAPVDPAPADSALETQLDTRIAQALDRAIARRDPHIEDAVIVDDVPRQHPTMAALAAIGAGGPPDPPVDLVAAGRGGLDDDEVPLDANTPKSDGSQGQPHSPHVQTQEERVAEAREYAREHRDPISTAASAEEIHAMGYDISTLRQPTSGPAVP